MSVGRMAKLWEDCPPQCGPPNFPGQDLPRCHNGAYQKREAPEPEVHSHIRSFSCSPNNNALSSLALGTGEPEPISSGVIEERPRHP